MPRFFVPKQEIGSSFLVLTGENAAHAKVLRLKNGDDVTICDGEGTDYICTVSDVANGQISLVVHSADPSQSEPKVACSVYMAFAKADKFEHVIQKATELGAAELVCFPSVRCVSRPDEKSLVKKLDRWQKIAASAAEQSRRGRIPQVIALPSYSSALKRAAEADLAVCFYENEEQLTFRAAIEAAPFRTASILTGPEGGFDVEEVEAAMTEGIHPITLGRRILRTETAGMTMLSILMFQLEQ